ncbi:MAG: tRNA glutamyl-Q(34) synthetase GluQRS [Planctomycetales bacterium]|nr:tRNA glutamyl-Q(34) synthetase GluQRS [Planctomycetales bacterium]
MGNARTFLINWALARQFDWQILLRIDDLDGPRVKAGADRQAIDDLAWLGIDWDDGPVYESACLPAYREAIDRLWTGHEIYACACTRAEIELASAPHAGDHELRYPGTCREARQTSGPSDAGDPDCGSPPELAPSDRCWRLHCPRGLATFEDQLLGRQECDVQEQVGDFVVLTKAGLPSYQLATVVDDRLHGITDIVRGDDLVDSTFRQLLIRERLGYDNSLRYWHLPIVVGEDGRRLAKRHGDSRISHYRELGVPPQRVLGLLRSWCGGERRPCEIDWFRESFQIASLPRERVTMTVADHHWLLGIR